MNATDSKRQRQRKPKVRTGCRTCKLRRVKCDEERPACRRCSSSGRACGGYELIASRGDHSRALAILPRPSNESPTQAPPSFSLNSAEAYNFDYFRTKTLHVLPGITRLIPWENLIMQVSQREPAVLSAAIAVGSIHRNFENDRWPGLVPDDLELQRTISQQQYGRAIRLLRDRLSDEQDPQRGEIALISCFLFICLELIQSDVTAALNHLRSGLQILREQSNRAIGQSNAPAIMRNNPASDSIMDQFMALFGRLDYQSTMFGENYPQLLVVPASNNTTSALWVPPAFTDLQEARQYSDVLASAVFAFRGHVVHDLACPGGAPSDRRIRLRSRWQRIPQKAPDIESLDPRLPERQNDLENRLIDWRRAFDKFTVKNIQSFTPEDHRAIKVSRIHHLAISMLLKECLSTRQMFFDQYLDEFKEMVDLADALHSEDSLLPSFSIDMGTQGPLYYVACKCRDSTTRHKAIELLLRSPRREGMWDGHMIGQFARQIVLAEESNAVLSGPDGATVHIPESARFSDVTLGFSDDGARGKIYFGRFQHELNGAWIVHETVFDLFQPAPWGFQSTQDGAMRSDSTFGSLQPVPDLKLTASFNASSEEMYNAESGMSSHFPRKSVSLNSFPTPSMAELEAVRAHQRMAQGEPESPESRGRVYTAERAYLTPSTTEGISFTEGLSRRASRDRSLDSREHSIETFFEEV